MRRPLVIAHVSDLHLSAEHKRYNLRRARRLLEAISRHAVDHVVVTGDIVSDADTRDYEVARRLFKNAGLLDPMKLSVVTGNHDIFGGVHVAEDILTFPRRCKQTDFGEKVEEFRTAFREAFDRCLFGSHAKAFPFAKIIGNVAFIGVNSVAHYSPVKNPIGSNGEIEKGQCRRLSQLLGSEPLAGLQKVILIHHHFNKTPGAGAGTLNTVWGAIERQTLKMRGKKRLIELFRESGAALVLHGHVHINDDYTRKGVRFINAGGAFLGPAFPHLSFNLIRIGPEGVENRVIQLPEEEPALPRAGELRPELQAA
ncbi:MAG TPA: metallophosphoesterase [Bacteroidota bacterium]|nr:metallophosphoesterase [Bacteroidota bacterium]